MYRERTYGSCRFRRPTVSARDLCGRLCGPADASWLSRAALPADEARDRRLIFGDNLAAVEVKGVLALLVDEVLHPFYIFQVRVPLDGGALLRSPAPSVEPFERP